MSVFSIKDALEKNTAFSDNLNELISDFFSNKSSRLRALEERKDDVVKKIENINKKREKISVEIKKLESIHKKLSEVKNEIGKSDSSIFYIYIIEYFLLEEIFRLKKENIEMKPNELLDEKVNISNFIEKEKIKQKILGNIGVTLFK